MIASVNKFFKNADHTLDKSKATRVAMIWLRLKVNRTRLCTAAHFPRPVLFATFTTIATCAKHATRATLATLVTHATLATVATLASVASLATLATLAT